MTRFHEIMAARGLTVAQVIKQANTYRTAAAILKGKDKAGPTMRARFAAVLDLPQSELFDANGWALPGTAEAV